VIDEMIRTLEYTTRFMGKSVADLPEAEMVEQPAGAPNHATWTLGHIIYSCHAMATELGAEPWLPEDWESVFGYGSTPRSREPRYPEKAELQTLLADATTRLCEALRGTDASVLGRRLSEEEDGDFPTMGDLLLQVIVAHTAYHAGQLAVWRRAMGKEPAAVFV
jgi:uncharacterized damage-inducible protein DinB